MPRTSAPPPSAAPRSSTPRQDEARWTAVVARDPAFDGRFFYSVETTGVYCRPSCGARRPNRVNVRFHDTAKDAERAGFRPCKRCKPTEPSLVQQHAEKVREACRLIETAEAEPRLDELAEAAGLSRYHFHRIFKTMLGVTPKAYAAAHRHKRVREELGRSATVTEAIYGAGFNSNGRFYATSSEVLGMTPSAFRSGGKHAEIRFAIGKSSLGLLLIAASAKGVCAIFFGDDADGLVRDLEKQFPRARTRRRRSCFRGTGLQGDRLRRRSAPRSRPSLGYPRHRLSASRMGSAPPHSAGRHRDLCGNCPGDRCAESGAGGGARLRLEPNRAGDPLSPRRRVEWVADRLSRRYRAKASAARQGGQVVTALSVRVSSRRGL